MVGRPVTWRAERFAIRIAAGSTGKPSCLLAIGRASIPLATDGSRYTAEEWPGVAIANGAGEGCCYLVRRVRRVIRVELSFYGCLNVETAYDGLFQVI
jgi:hypothetical protein